MDDLIKQLIPYLILTVFGGVIALMFFFIRGYFKSMREKINKIDEKHDKTIEALLEVSKALATLSATLEGIPNKVDENGKLIAKVDGQIEMIRRDVRDATEKLQNAVRDVHAQWRFIEGAHQRASDTG